MRRAYATSLTFVRPSVTLADCANSATESGNRHRTGQVECLLATCDTGCSISNSTEEDE